MKHNWTYKKLGDVATINYGTRVVQKRDGGTIYPVYGGGDATFRMDTYNRENCLVVARFAMSPKCTRRVSGKFFLNDSGLTLEAKEGIRQDYLDWHIIALNDLIYKTAKGAAQKNLDVKTFTSLSIEVPSLDEQKAIVAELDGINHLIDLQEQQLREYDKLAQSLFYSTFGDPATNPKGWEVKKLIDFCGIQYGFAFDSKCFTEDSSYPPIIRIRDVIRGFTETFYKGTIPEDYYIEAGDYLIGMDGEFNIAPWQSKKALLNQRVCKIFALNNKVSMQYVYYLMKRILKQIEDETPCVTVKHLSAKRLNQLDFPLPPLALQQTFAAQIEAIEQQKALVRRSLDETRTLLAARMQYYFE